MQGGRERRAWSGVDRHGSLAIMTQAWRYFFSALAFMAAAAVVAALWDKPAIVLNAFAPAWLQAFGSLVGLGVAIAVSAAATDRARHTALEMENRRAISRLEVAYHIAHQSAVLRDFVRRRMDGGPQRMGAADFASVKDAIDAIPIGELPSGDVVTQLMAIRRVTGFIEAANDLWEKPVTSFDQIGKTAAARAEFELRSTALDKALASLEEAVDRAVERLNELHKARPWDR